MLQSSNYSEPVREHLGATMAGLVDLLGSDDIQVRRAALEGLVCLGSAAVPVLHAALQSTDRQKQWAAIHGLLELGDTSPVPLLIRALEDDDDYVRWKAAEELVKTGNAAVTPLLHRLIEHPDCVWLREGAHYVLRHLAFGWRAHLLTPVLTALHDVEPTLETPVAAFRALLALEAGEHSGFTHA